MTEVIEETCCAHPDYIFIHPSLRHTYRLKKIASTLNHKVEAISLKRHIGEPHRLVYLNKLYSLS